MLRQALALFLHVRAALRIEIPSEWCHSKSCAALHVTHRVDSFVDHVDTSTCSISARACSSAHRDTVCMVSLTSCAALHVTHRVDSFVDHVDTSICSISARACSSAHRDTVCM